MLEVGCELKVIQAMCAREGRTLTAIVHVTGSRFPLLPTGAINREDYLRKIVNAMDKKKKDAISELIWVPGAEQIKEVALKLGLPLPSKLLDFSILSSSRA